MPARTTRVRTGCLTCRKRRIKCDEFRPSCKRCINANLHCDGYEKKRFVIAKTDDSVRPTLAQLTSRLCTPEIEPALFDLNPNLSLSSEVALSSSYGLSASHHGQFPAYHQYVTRTYMCLGKEDVHFWRDFVATLGWSSEIVLEAILALGTIDRLHTMTGQGVPQDENARLKIAALKSNRNAMRLLSVTLKQKKSRLVAVVVLIMLSYFECYMNAARSALRYLWLAQAHFNELWKGEPESNADLGPVWRTLMRLDFLAQSIVPYAQSSLLRAIKPDNTLQQSPAEVFVGHVDNMQHVLCQVALDRAQLIHLISSFNNISKVVWAPWYDMASRPDATALRRFQTALLRWKSRSFITRFFHIENDHFHTTPLDQLAIPPKPRCFGEDQAASDAAITIMLYNTYMACSLSLSYAYDQCQDDQKEMFHHVYDNLCIAEGIAVGSGFTTKIDCLDMGLGVPLYLGFRRCYSESWQQWTIAKLLLIGREGLHDGQTLAKTLLILLDVQSHETHGPSPDNKHLTGYMLPVQQRIVPLLLPSDDGSQHDAYFAKPFSNGLDCALEMVIVAKASWRMNPSGIVEDLQLDHLSAQHTGKDSALLNSRLPWRQFVELGWHGFL